MKKLIKLIYLVFTAFLFACTSIKDSSTSTIEKIISHASKAVGKNQNEIKKFREEFGVKIEWGKPYDMVGPSRMIPLFNMGE